MGSNKDKGEKMVNVRLPESAHEMIKVIQERYSDHGQRLSLGDALVAFIEAVDPDIAETAQLTLEMRDKLRARRRGDA